MGSLSVVLKGKYGRQDTVIRHSRKVATQHRFLDLVCARSRVASDEKICELHGLDIELVST